MVAVAFQCKRHDEECGGGSYDGRVVVTSAGYVIHRGLCQASAVPGCAIRCSAARVSRLRRCRCRSREEVMLATPKSCGGRVTLLTM